MLFLGFCTSASLYLQLWRLCLTLHSSGLAYGNPLTFIVRQHMQHVRVLVTKLVNNDFPGWVEFFISGLDGVAYRFVEKAPVVSAASLDYPAESKIACRILNTSIQPDGSVWSSPGSVDKFQLPFRSCSNASGLSWSR